MSDDFTHQCRRRLARQRSAPQEPIVAGRPPSAGSGGDADGNDVHHCAGLTGCIAAAHYYSAIGGDGQAPRIELLAAGSDQGGGELHARASKGIRLTVAPAGVPPETIDPDICGVEVEVGDFECIHLQRGIDDNPMRGVIAMNLDGIGINAYQGGVWLKSDTLIKLMVAGGTSSIALTPTGIVMQGPIIQIN